ncbi:MAG: branched-chain amino acid ABC transporter permease, partial [Geobacteraceae bacterium]|nr:branched-chain amino acid ABC transporter permease [Geobacteraceae bacterium]
MELGNQLLQYLLSGLSTGAIYALIGVGFSIIYNATGIINFAQGEFVMLGGMLTLFLMETLQLPLWAAIPLAVLLATLVGLLFERLAIRPLRKASPISLVIITIGGSILIRGLSMLIWDKDTHALPPFSGDEPIMIAGATVLPQHFWILGITVVLIALNKWFF